LRGYTALHYAAKNGKLEIIKLLAGKYKIDVDRRTNGGYSALHLAAMHDRKEAIGLLIDVYHANPKIRDFSGRTYDRYLDNSCGTRLVKAKHLKALGRQNAPFARSCKTSNSFGIYANLENFRLQNDFSVASNYSINHSNHFNNYSMNGGGDESSYLMDASTDSVPKNSIAESSFRRLGSIRKAGNRAMKVLGLQRASIREEYGN